MVYNSHASSLDCVSEILKICNCTVTNYPLNDITRRFNSALDWYFGLAFKSDGRWNFDDINETSPPIDEQNLVSGTNRYKFGTFTETVINLLRLEILTADAKGKTLIQETIQSLGVGDIAPESGSIGGINEQSFHELYLSPASGTPTHYCKYGDFVYLRPSPNYAETDGLKAYFSRPAAYMAATDTTKVPGVSVMHHDILCRKAALPYLIENNQPSGGAIAQLLIEDKQTILDYFARRGEDMKNRLTVRQEDCR